MFYLIEITTYNNGTKDAFGVYAHETEDSATSAFHQKLAGAMRNETYQTEMCLVLDANGVVRKFEKWTRKTVPEVGE